MKLDARFQAISDAKQATIALLEALIVYEMHSACEQAAGTIASQPRGLLAVQRMPDVGECDANAICDAFRELRSRLDQLATQSRIDVTLFDHEEPRDDFERWLEGDDARPDLTLS